MPIAEAKALARRSGQDANCNCQILFEIQDYDPAADREAIEKLATWTYQFTPLAGVDDHEAPETLLLDLQYATDLQKDENRLIAEIQTAFKRLRLHIRLGVASTIGTAWAIAHFGETNSTIVPPDKQADWLANLPMEALRISPQSLSQLERLGLRTIGQLYPLPRIAMQSRFGNGLLKRLDQALGNAPETIDVVQLPPEFETDWIFENPMEHRPSIDHVIQLLVERLCNLLQAHQRGALQIICTLTCQDRSVQAVNVGLFRPSAEPVHLLKLLDMHLEQIRLTSPVTKVTVTAGAHHTFDDNQTRLFDQPKRQHDSALVGSVMDRIAGRLGRESVVRCSFRADAQPELAVRYNPAISSATSNSRPRFSNRQSSAYTTKPGPLDRPLHLLPRPAAIKVRSVMKGGPIREFVWDNDHYEIAKLWGPERIETGWWRQRGVRRDYYRVETNQGNRYWLFRCLRERQWYLHGVFG